MTSPVESAVQRCMPADSPVVVALGGGADSAMLASAAVGVLGADRVRAVFVYHHLPQSEMLRSAAENLSRTLGIDIAVLDGPVDEGPDLESRARLIRYRAIEQNLKPDEVCCTAHTGDDQAETVLMRVMRGAGATGLSGIPAERHPFYRPLLEFSRSEIRDLADAESLPYADDPSNVDPRFLRSRIRHELLPMIEEDYADGIRTNLGRVASYARADDAVLGRTADAVPLELDGSAVLVPMGALAGADTAVATRVLRRALRPFHDPYTGSADDIQQMLRTVNDRASRTLTGDVSCTVEGPHLVLAAKAHHPASQGRTIEPGQQFEWAGDRYSVRETRRPSDWLLSDIRTSITVGVDASVAIRPPVDGDRIDIDGGSTPVSEVLRAHDVFPRKRGNWMLITVGGHIAAVRGIRLAPWARPVSGRPGITIEREGHS